MVNEQKIKKKIFILSLGTKYNFLYEIWLQKYFQKYMVM